MKKCSKCGIEKEDHCFEKQRAQCKVCRASYIAERAQLASSKIAKIKAQAKYAGTEKGKRTDRKYQQSNKGKKTRNFRQKQIRETNPTVKLRDIIRGSVNKALKRNDASKNGNSCLDYLPYTIEELKEYLESQFEPWMSWENHGKYNAKTWNDLDPATWTWQIDHKEPHSNFSYISMDDQAFKDCWALDNLQPLSAKQNVLDGANRTRHTKSQ